MWQADVQTLRDAYAAVSRGDWDVATRRLEVFRKREDALEAAESLG